MAIKLYTKEYAGLLPNVFQKKSHFLRTFGGTIQIVEGVKDKENFMYLKITDTDVVIQSYSTDGDTGFGSGTGNSSRFGERKEVKAVDHEVKYEAPLAIHEGIDDFTVNDIPAQVVAERLALHAEAWVENMNSRLSKSLSDNAGKTITGELTEAGVTKAFSDAHKTFVNNKVSKDVDWVAYVTADVYDFLVDHKLATTSKGSSANIDEQSIKKFKGFILEELADEYFQEDENVYFAADNVGVVGTGIQVVRTLDSEDFAGVALQGAAKYGKYIPEKNKKAIAKATLTESDGDSGE